MFLLFGLFDLQSILNTQNTFLCQKYATELFNQMRVPDLEQRKKPSKLEIFLKIGEEVKQKMKSILQKSHKTLIRKNKTKNYTHPL